MIIGLAGRINCGKDTLADYLVDKHNYIKLRFSQPLKDGCAAMFGFTQDQVNNDKETKDEFWGVTPRLVLQFIGTEVFREKINEIIPVGGDFWVKTLAKKLNDKDDFVIADVRFQNEVDMIKSKGGTVVRIIRENGLKDSHVSEESCDALQGCISISNNATKEDLYKGLENILSIVKECMS